MDIDPYLAALAAAFVAAFAVSAATNGVVRRIPPSESLSGLLGNERRPPQLGGLPILVAFAIAPFVASLLSERADEYFSPKRMEFLGFMGAVALIFATGVVDDLRTITPWQKLVGQVVAALAVYFAGYQLESVAFPWHGSVDLGVLALPATVLWVVFFTNALNLIDGKDGVATGVGVFAAAAIAAVAADTHHPAVALLFVGLAGAGLGFLPFNLPSASLILGDSGALVFGFVLASLSIRGATGIEESVFVSVPILAMGFPVLNTLLAVARRILDRRHPFHGDEDHIHDRLEQLDLGPRGLLLTLYALSALFALAALGTHFVDSLVAEALIFAGLIALIGLTLGKLGYLVSLWNSHRVRSMRARFVRD